MKYLILLLYIWVFSHIPESGGYEIAIIGGLIRGIGASRDAKRFQSLADSINPIRPTYETPQEVGEYVSNARSMYNADMPGFGRMINQAYDATGNFLDQARGVSGSGRGVLQSLSQADVNQRRNLGDINQQNLGFRQSNFGAFQNALLNSANYRDREFDVNEMQPYLQEESDKRQYQEAAWNQRQASREGWASFADGVVNTAAMALSAPVGVSGQSTFARLFGKKNNERTDSTAIPSPSRTLPGLNMPTTGIYR